MMKGISTVEIPFQKTDILNGGPTRVFSKKAFIVVSVMSHSPSEGAGRLGVYGPILGRLPLRVFSIGKYAFQKKSLHTLLFLSIGIYLFIYFYRLYYYYSHPSLFAGMCM